MEIFCSEREAVDNLMSREIDTTVSKNTSGFQSPGIVRSLTTHDMVVARSRKEELQRQQAPEQRQDPVQKPTPLLEDTMDIMKADKDPLGLQQKQMSHVWFAVEFGRSPDGGILHRRVYSVVV